MLSSLFEKNGFKIWLRKKKVSQIWEAEKGLNYGYGNKLLQPFFRTPVLSYVTSYESSLSSLAGDQF
jgi:hypothetical protein